MSFIRVVSALAIASSLARGQSTPPRGWFGMSIRPMADGRVAIDDVFPDAPAERMGLMPGDVLLRIRSAPATRATVEAALQGVAVGDTMTITVARRQGHLRVFLKAMARPRIDEAAIDSDDVVTIHVDTLRSLMLGYLDAARRGVRIIAPSDFYVDQSDSAPVLRGRNRGINLRLDSLLARGERVAPGAAAVDSSTGNRVIIARAQPEKIGPIVAASLPQRGLESVAGVVVVTAAAGTGLHPLDVITRYGSATIRSVAQLREAVARETSATVAVSVMRQGRRVDLRVPALR